MPDSISEAQCQEYLDQKKRENVRAHVEAAAGRSSTDVPVHFGDCDLRLERCLIVARAYNQSLAALESSAGVSQLGPALKTCLSSLDSVRSALGSHSATGWWAVLLSWLVGLVVGLAVPVGVFWSYTRQLPWPRLLRNYRKFDDGECEGIELPAGAVGVAEVENSAEMVDISL